MDILWMEILLELGDIWGTVRIVEWVFFQKDLATQKEGPAGQLLLPEQPV